MVKSIVINQPYYFPRLHWWNRIMSADIVVLLDNVHHNTNFKCNRAVFYDGISERFLTIPINKKQKRDPICDIRISTPNIWKKDHLNKFESYYSREKYFYEVFDLLKTFMQNYSSIYMNDILLDSIYYISNIIDISKDKFFRSSDIDVGDAKKNQRLINICEHFDAKILYLGGGSKEYVNNEIELYNKAGIDIKFQDWKCPVDNYSILDAFVRYGIENTLNFIRR